MAAKAQSRSKAAQTVARQLERYREMRDFQVTAEPRGGHSALSQPALPFVVQKHAATRLHYDFRLGWHGVLKSWAVTKGPSYYPGDRRLAVEVEDHPMEYGGFEGTIPTGQYGGGTVMVWDFGTWKPLGDVDRGLADGHLKFELEGEKLKGRWALVRMHGPRERADKPNWLLIKDRDEFAREKSDPYIIDEAPESAMTHRSLGQIAANADSVWDSVKGFQSDGGAPASEPEQVTKTAASAVSAHAAKRPAAKPSLNPSKLLQSAPRESYPGFVEPELAQQAIKAPGGNDWIHELKLDGYRIQIHIRAAKDGTRSATLYTRKGLDWTKRMPDIARAAAQLQVDAAILDGEVVSLDGQGIASFADLQAAFQEGRARHLTYFAFDLLHLDGHNLRGFTLLERKQLLVEVLAKSDAHSPLRFSEHFEARGDEVFRKVCTLGAEGIVSKFASATYDSGRSLRWRKIKCIQEQEFVIGGFTQPSKGGHGIGALLLGYYRDGNLIYAGRCGTGFTDRTQRSLRTQLDKLKKEEIPFAEVPREARRDAYWVKPTLVAQIAFSTWTRDNLVRQASFKGLREDKPAKEVMREMPAAVESTAPARRSAATTKSVARGNSEVSRKVNEQKMIELAITHPEKVLDPESGMTKQVLAEYLLAVSERMLPHVADRPLSVVRCPEGSEKPCFFQKHIGRGLPTGVKSIAVPNRKNGGMEQYLTLDSAEGLIGLAQMGVLEIHPWGSRNESLDQPDRIVFDLDPDAKIDWQTLAASAEMLRTRLKKLRLESFLKSTGGKGLHVVVPVVPEFDWAVVKQFAHALVLEMEAQDPALYITKMTKAARTNKIYLDYLRNDRGSTSIAPFSPRARSGASVAMTLAWKELHSPGQPRFNVTDFPSWRARLKRDPWKVMAGFEQRLTPKMLAAVSPGTHAPLRRPIRRSA